MTETSTKVRKGSTKKVGVSSGVSSPKMLGGKVAYLEQERARRKGNGSARLSVDERVLEARHEASERMGEDAARLVRDALTHADMTIIGLARHMGLASGSYISDVVNHRVRQDPRTGQWRHNKVSLGFLHEVAAATGCELRIEMVPMQHKTG
jgi:hypothetical protein